MAKAKARSLSDTQPEPQLQQSAATPVAPVVHKPRLPDGSERCTRCTSGCLNAAGICEACGHSAYTS